VAGERGATGSVAQRDGGGEFGAGGFEGGGGVFFEGGERAGGMEPGEFGGGDGGWFDLAQFDTGGGKTVEHEQRKGGSETAGRGRGQRGKGVEGGLRLTAAKAGGGKTGKGAGAHSGRVREFGGKVPVDVGGERVESCGKRLVGGGECGASGRRGGGARGDVGVENGERSFLGGGGACRENAGERKRRQNSECASGCGHGAGCFRHGRATGSRKAARTGGGVRGTLLYRRAGGRFPAAR